MFRRVAAVLSAILLVSPVNVYGMSCHELAMSYILADQDKPTKLGDKFYTDENEPNPILCETTAYYEGTHGSHGDLMKEGYCAASPEMYGDMVMLYEAIPQSDGSYHMGSYILSLIVKDTGYGYPVSNNVSETVREQSPNKSTVRNDKKVVGTIESGVHIDKYEYSYEACKKWMKRTNGKVFAVIIEGKG